jgi:photosystem II stability/assembly factor-like uncharacterized protein
MKISWTCLVVVFLVACTPLAASPPVPLASWMEDAELTDVFFLDQEQGWAVGDRGVIWYTSDGGHHWQRRESGVTGKLESIHFVDRQHGWICGGWTRSYSHRTRGILLKTTDGGRSWKRVPNLRLPRLKLVFFVDSLHGWALGENSTLCPSGIFLTRDGGTSWTMVVQGPSQPWLAGDFYDAGSGLVIGNGGMVARVTPTRAESIGRPPWGTRRLNALKLAGMDLAWLVGDGGLVAVSHDTGRHWSPPAGSLPLANPGQFDFQTVSVVDNHCWIAGNPGSIVLHSADGGESWQRQQTGQSLPIRSICFVDPRNGWAVGALGTILVTRDGGDHWQRQRSGGARAAVLGMFSSEKTTVYELFSLLSGNDGYLGVAQLVTTPIEGKGDMFARWQESISVAGGSSAGQVFTVPRLSDELAINPERLLDNWDRAVDGSVMKLLDRQLVKSIRTWRPSVVVTEPSGPSASAVQQLVQKVVQSAVERAADATWYPEQLAEGGLESWQVSRLFAVEQQRKPTVRINTSQLAPKLGMSVSQHAARARAVTMPGFEKMSTAIGFTLLLANGPAFNSSPEMMAGIQLPPGGDARRQITVSAATDVDALLRASRQWRNMQQLVENGLKGTIPAISLVAQLDNMLAPMPADNGGQILFQLARQYHQQGRMDLAAELLIALGDRYPQHDLVETAQVYLVQYYASGEVAWQQRKATGLKTGQVRLEVDLKPADPSGVQLGEESPVRQAQFARPRSQGTWQSAMTEAASGQRARLAIQLARSVQQQQPELYQSPEFRFPLSVAQRQFGTPRDAERVFHQIVSSRRDAWRQSAQAELWFLHGRGLPPKLTVSSRRSQVPPYLDGILNEPGWQAAEPLSLKSPLADDEQYPATAWVMHDARFLYLAARCRKAPGAAYPTVPAARQRDADMTGQDRIEFWLDMDRDYVTFYRLELDFRGWGSEKCWDHVGWNPRWFIARSETASDWTVEVAIPWSELAPAAPGSRAVWAMGVQRTIPGIGFQSWSPRLNGAGQQAGLVLFE